MHTPNRVLFAVAGPGNPEPAPGTATYICVPRLSGARLALACTNVVRRNRCVPEVVQETGCAGALNQQLLATVMRVPSP
jgi:hypothetical protein